ncbi:hypothetical protein [Lentzea sp. NPDC051838]|uniref:hypothetical protein n=1 Tax=Lentzea sp. NPDC051838 TaxID=3154849 RepID=UPI0034214A53
MQKVFAVAMTAALVLPVVATSAAAQDETITVEGVIFLDRNFNEKYDAGETVRANGPGVQVKNKDGEKVAEFGTDANGRYKAVLPKASQYLVLNMDKDGFNTPFAARVVTENTTLDFPVWGSFIDGFSFVDTNGDGVKQADEQPSTGEIKVSGKAIDGTQVDATTKPGVDGSYRFELKEGAYTVTAPDLARSELAIAKPLGANDIDWVTGQAKAGARNTRIDIRYFKPKADAAIEEFTVTPDKDVYTVGDQVDIRIKLANRGDNPGKLSFLVFLPTGKILSHSKNVVGEDGDFETVAPLLPGESLTVEVKAEFTAPEDPKEPNINLGPYVRPWVGGHKDVERGNQGSKFSKRVQVVEKSTTTSPSETTTTTSPTSTTTTTPAVAKAGNKTGLASTGASPLGFLALGSVLLAAGLSAFFVARRRRS